MEIEIPAYHEVWMDNGLVNLYRILTEVKEAKMELNDSEIKIRIKDIEQFMRQFSKEIESRRDSKIFVKEKNKKTGASRNIRKDFMLVQYGRKIGDKNVLKERIYIDPNNVVKDVFLSLDFKKMQNCVLCNFNPRSKLSYIRLRQAVYPFVTKIKSLSGIRSLREQYNQLCSICYLVGTLEWCDEGFIYRTFRDKGYSLVFLPILDKLKVLDTFKRKYIATLLNNTDRHSNIRSRPKIDKTEKTPGEYSTLLCFYEKFLNYCCLENEEKRSWMKIDLIKKETCRDWLRLRVPHGQVKNIKVGTLGVKDEILGVAFELLKRNVLLYEHLIMKTLFLRKTAKGMAPDFNITNELRESLAKSFITDNFHLFSHYFLPKKQGKNILSRGAKDIMDEVIIEWRLKRMNLDLEDLGTVKSVGNIIAETAIKSISLLYKIDRTRSLDEFWDVLREISRKMVGLDADVKKKIKPSSVDDLIQLIKKDEHNWTEVKNLLVVYSCMYYSIKTRE